MSRRSWVFGVLLVILALASTRGVGAAGRTAYVTLDIRIIDNETGEVVYAASEQGSAKQRG